MSSVADILKSALGSYIFYLIITAGFGSLFYKYISKFQLTLNGFHFLIGTLFLVGVLFYIFKSKNYRVIKDRESSMSENAKLLKLKNLNYILSTRLTYWDISDKSPERYEYRNSLTKAIQKGVLTKRIWQINSESDLIRLKACLSEYKDHDNYNVKTYDTTLTFVPEITLVDGKALAVSIPEPKDPRKMSITFQFRKKKDIAFWKAYFDILWENATPIKVGNKVFNDNLNSLIIN